MCLLMSSEQLFLMNRTYLGQHQRKVENHSLQSFARIFDDFFTKGYQCRLLVIRPQQLRETKSCKIQWSFQGNVLQASTLHQSFQHYCAVSREFFSSYSQSGLGLLIRAVFRLSQVGEPGERLETPGHTKVQRNWPDMAALWTTLPPPNTLE